MTYVWAKAKRTCVLLAIAGEEREIQNAQVNFIKVGRQKKKVIRRSVSLLENMLYSCIVVVMVRTYSAESTLKIMQLRVFMGKIREEINQG